MKYNKKITFRLEKETFEKLNQISKDEYLSISEVMRFAVLDYIDNYMAENEEVELNVFHI